MDNEETTLILNDEGIHQWFELSYASYLVLPRSVMQSAPPEWQRRFVACLNELEEMFGRVPERGIYSITLKGQDGFFIEDPLKDYERGRRVIPRKVGEDGEG